MNQIRERLYTARALATCRRAAGLTQKDLAERIPCSTDLISQIERGIRDPNFQLLCVLARILGVTPNDLCSPDWGFGEGKKNPEKPDLTERLLLFCRTPQTKREMMAFCGLSSEAWFRAKILDPLLKKGSLRRTVPEKASSPKQRYVTADSRN